MKALNASGMALVGAQTTAALGSKDLRVVQGWTQQDEPDNAQPESGGGYGPPVSPATIVSRYQAMTKADPTRPVFLNFGQGVANDTWKGRGTRTGHLEDYPQYLKGADIVSFDIYPVVHRDAAVRGKLEFVAKGVERLVGWSKGTKVVWNVVECTHINSKVMPTPADVRAEVWMSLVHGSMGIIYFAHEWYPKFVEAGVLQYPAMTRQITLINAQIQSLAGVLNSRTDRTGARVASSKSTVPIAYMLKRHGGASWLFTVAMRKDSVKAKFTVSGLPARAVATVLGENREIPVVNGVWRDDFGPYGVHLYRIMAKTLDGVPRKIPVSTGGKQKLDLAAGSAQAFRNYWMFASLSGTVPGIEAGAVTLPLNYDALTAHTLFLPNQIIAKSQARFDAQGRASASIDIPRLGAPWIGTTIHLAYVSFTGCQIHLASNPVGLTLVK